MLKIIYSDLESNKETKNILIILIIIWVFWCIIHAIHVKTLHMHYRYCTIGNVMT